MVADDLAVDLDSLALADFNADGAVELERAAAGGYLGVAVDNADLFAQLVDKDSHAVALVDSSGELSERLRHKTGVQTDVAVAHFAFDFSLGNESRYGVDNDNVDRAASDKTLCDFERVLNVDKRDVAAVFLTLRDAVQRKGGFTGGLGTVDLHDSASGKSADAESDVEGEGAG